MLGRSAFVAACLHAAACAVFNPLNFGAKGDGVTDDTAAVRATLAAAEAAGGGTVLFPSQFLFLTGAFNLTSNVWVQVDGTLLAYSTIGTLASTVYHYPIIPPLPWYGGGQDYQESGAPEYQAFIHSWYNTNITITGSGLIDGQGQPWWSCIQKPAAPCFSVSRPQLMMLVHSTDILMTNLRVQDSPSWNLHFANCTNVFVDNVTVTAPSNSPNTDGFDIDCSVNVTIQGSYYSGGDDAVAVKSGMDYLGRTFGRTTRDVIVRNMTIGTTHGISVGSEMSAGVENVLFEDILMNGSSAGPHVKSCRGRGGIVQNITYRRITTVGVDNAIYVTLNYHKGLLPTNATATPQFHNLLFEDQVHTNAQHGVTFDGLPESNITGVVMNNISFVNSTKCEETCDYTEGTCEDVQPSCPSCFE